MLRSMNKKKLSLLFAIVLLGWCGQMKPMRRVKNLLFFFFYSNGGQGTTEKTIKDLSSGKDVDLSPFFCQATSGIMPAASLLGLFKLFRFPINFGVTGAVAVISPPDSCEIPPTGTTIEAPSYRCLRNISEFHSDDEQQNCELRLVNKRFKHAIDGEKKIKDIPRYCLCNIFQFFADVGGSNTSMLRLVSKEFKHVIDGFEYPCYLANIQKIKTLDDNKKASTFLPFRPCFLPFPMYFNGYYEDLAQRYRGAYEVWLDENIRDRFVGEIAQLELKGVDFHIYMKLREKRSYKSLSKSLKSLSSELKKNNNQLRSFEITYHDAPGLIQMIEYEKKHGIEVLNFLKKDVITNEELNLFGRVQGRLYVQSCKNFGTSEIEWSSKLKALKIVNCNKFDCKYLKGLSSLKKLVLAGLNRVKLEDAGLLKKLEFLTVKNADMFNITGLEKLKNLHTFKIDTSGKLTGSLPERLTNIHQLCVRYDKNHDIGEEVRKKIEKKVCTILEIAEKLNNLRKFNFPKSFGDSGGFADEFVEKFSQSVEKIRKNGCEIKLDGY